ncbi:hypothetical protein Tco_1455058, partial [Tanacetum coccineum]
KEYEAKDAAARYGYLVSQETAEIISQAEAEIQNHGVSADRDPAGIDSAGGVSAGSTSAGSDPAGVPSDVCKDQLSSGIFTSSSYDDDFSATLTNLAPAVEVNPVPTKRVNTIHPQSQILGDLASPVLTRSRAQKSKFGESAFIGYIQDQQRTTHTDQLHCLSACFLSQLEPTSIAKALEDPDWVDAMQEEMQPLALGLEKEAKNTDIEIALENKVKELDNIVCKMGQSAQTVHMLTKPQETNVISIADSEETLMLEEESRSKMLLKQSDPMVLENKRELSDEQALHPITHQSASSPVKIETPRELPKKQFLIENDRLLDQIISQDIVNIVVNSSVDVNTSVKVNSSVVMNDSVNNVEMCNKCLELEAELIKQHNMVEKMSIINF